MIGMSDLIQRANEILDMIKNEEDLLNCAKWYREAADLLPEIIAFMRTDLRNIGYLDLKSKYKDDENEE
jgi:hypothetical protein